MVYNLMSKGVGKISSFKKSTEVVGVSKSHIYLVLLSIVVIANIFIFGKIVRTNIPDHTYSLIKTPDFSKDTPAAIDPIETKPLGYKYLSSTNEDIYSGNLILVNSEYEFKFGNTPSIVPKSELVGMYPFKTSNYTIRDNAVQLNSVVTTDLNNMIDGFVKEKGLKTLMILSAYRTIEEQEKILNSKIESLGEEQGRLIASEPKFSEHHTGYAFDFTIYDNGVVHEYDGTGDYSWLTENSWKYGFILRYPDGKTDITKYQYESWHFRYVGLPHSQYMYENSLCLEEYITKLKEFTFGGETLKINAVDGNEYEIYYVPSGEQIPVPDKQNCEIAFSGNNVDGIIVTIKYLKEVPIEENNTQEGE